jgi:hypothetical protein
MPMNIGSRARRMMATKPFFEEAQQAIETRSKK